MPEADLNRELVLSAEVSEWLFYTGFWGYVSQACGIQFLQYEEEVLPRGLISMVIDALSKIKEELSANPVQEIRFLCGWNERKEGIFCEINSAIIFREVVRLEEYFLVALNISADIYCQL
uniref:Uncharacterized protein n=1 Tax=Ralstonia solanacearum TaxID=305 RepID=A0A0S4X2H6_RALSL|nr:protein of unknown function [Ralstonia solanacearum]